MGRKLYVALFAALLVVSGGALASSAFTTATIDRSAEMDVVADQNAIIALNDESPGGLVAESSGKLTIDFNTTTGGSGVNPNSEYVIGDNSTANTTSAFSITNLDDTSHNISLSYTQEGTNAAGDQVTFTVYDASNNLVATVTDETAGATVTGVSSGATLYVVISVDASGQAVGEELGGTLTITAN